MHRAVITAYIADLAVITAKIADLAVGTGKIDNLAVTQGKIANLAVGTAQIQDAAITNAKVFDLVADKITTGNLQSTLTITGLLKTSASGNRVEITSSGIDILTDDNGASAASSYIEWWRIGQGDTEAFAAVYGYWSASQTWLISYASQKGTYIGGWWAVVEDAAGGIEGSILMSPTSNKVTIDGDYDGSSKGLIELYKGRQSLGHTILLRPSDAGVTGTVRLRGSGMVYENGWSYTATPNATADTNVSYTPNFPPETAAPDNVMGINAGSAATTIRAEGGTTSGASIRMYNHLVDKHASGATSATGSGIPVVT
jgi:hypothetical protein